MKTKGLRFSDREIQRIRDDTRISDVIGRFVTWDRKKTNPGRGDWWAPCPFHGEKNASFHCEDGKGRYHCFGCGASGDVFRFLMEKAGVTFPEAIAELGGHAEQSKPDPVELARQRREREQRMAADRAKIDRKKESTRERAYRLWREAGPLPGTLAEAYLRHRGIDFTFPCSTLRFHPSMSHPDAGDRGPCLVAAVQAPDDRFLGIWRIYLDAAGRKRADVKNEKLGLGAYTEAGGAVRLGRIDGTTHVVEGIETGFGVMGITGGESVLCGLNTSGMRTLIPPPDASALLIWPDGDVDKIRHVDRRDGTREERRIKSPGIEAARALKARMDADDFPCSIQPTPRRGRDYLDVFNASRNALREPI